MKGMPQFDMDNPAKWIDQHGGIENAMLMQGGGGGTAMTFVHLNNQTIKSKEQAEEMVVNWRNLLMTAGIEVGVYVIEPHMLLLDTQDKRKVVEIKDFITKEAPGGEEHVEYFEYNSQKFYSEAKDPKPKAEWLKTSIKMGQMKAFNTLAKQFVSGDSSAMAAAGAALPSLRNAEETECAEFYIKTMQRLLEKGDGYPKAERARLKKLMDQDKLAEDKKTTFEKRRNILAVFAKAVKNKAKKTAGDVAAAAAAAHQEMPTQETEVATSVTEVEQALLDLVACAGGWEKLEMVLRLGDAAAIKAKYTELQRKTEL